MIWTGCSSPWPRLVSRRISSSTSRDRFWASSITMTIRLPSRPATIRNFLNAMSRSDLSAAGEQPAPPRSSRISFRSSAAVDAGVRDQSRHVAVAQVRQERLDGHRLAGADGAGDHHDGFAVVEAVDQMRHALFERARLVEEVETRRDAEGADGQSEVLEVHARSDLQLRPACPIRWPVPAPIGATPAATCVTDRHSRVSPRRGRRRP